MLIEFTHFWDKDQTKPNRETMSWQKIDPDQSIGPRRTTNWFTILRQQILAKSIDQSIDLLEQLIGSLKILKKTKGTINWS